MPIFAVKFDKINTPHIKNTNAKMISFFFNNSNKSFLFIFIIPIKNTKQNKIFSKDIIILVNDDKSYKGYRRYFNELKNILSPVEYQPVSKMLRFL